MARYLSISEAKTIVQELIKSGQSIRYFNICKQAVFSCPGCTLVKMTRFLEGDGRLKTVQFEYEGKQYVIERFYNSVGTRCAQVSLLEGTVVQEKTEYARKYP